MRGSGRAQVDRPRRTDREAWRRVLVIGNSGAGKSTLAARLSATLDTPAVLDLDLVHWREDGVKQPEETALRAVAMAAAGRRWIIEGVYGWLAAPALARATALVWLDLSPQACRAGLESRGLRRAMTPDDQTALLAWADGYWNRTTSTSHAGHLALFDRFAGVKHRITSRTDADVLGSSWSQERRR